MADALRIPRYNSPESSLARRQRRNLNPIIEEDSDDARGQHEQRGRRAELKINAWLSPMSDHFPTPRGMHYLSAPVLPSSPSNDSADTSPTTSSNPWNRASVATEATEFEDLYDVSEEEVDDALSKMPERMASAQSRLASARQPTPLVIPVSRENSTDSWSAVDELKKLSSPVPITPSVQFPMSPAQVEFMDLQQAVEIPTISAPPSLDGSLTSEQLAAMSAPPTPIIGNEEITTEEAWAGVQLQPGALATLQALSTGEDLHEQPAQVIEVPQPPARLHPVPEMQQSNTRLVGILKPLLTRSTSLAANQHRQTFAELTKLDIPSPGGFFSGLDSPRTRNTWHMPSMSPEDLPPPTSTTAEQFYRCPWNANTTSPALPVLRRKEIVEDFYRNVKFTPAPTEPRVIEQVLEVRLEDLDDDMPTARPVIEHRNTDSSNETVKPPASPDAEDAPAEIVVDYDPNYARKQQQEALGNLDRTELWLVAQRSYLRPIDDETSEDDGALDTITEASEDEEANGVKAEPQSEPQPELSLLSRKKTVRFSNLVSASNQPKRLPSKLSRQESAYYRAFQDYIIRTQRQDVFVHQLARFEALQGQRVSLRESHRNQLLGKYQLSVVPQSAKKRLSSNVARGDDVLTDDPEKLRHEKEVEAMNQMMVSTWHVAAIKMLNGGRLISAPVTKRLARLSRMAPSKDGLTRDRARILDLGGQSACDWAWHCALQFPNTKIYTVTTKTIRQLSNANIRGPPNHRQVAVERLARLPFADNQFDLISARELHSMLKYVGENGEDEWNSCLKECMRVLKPGGYLEFSLLDSDIINAGPVGLAKSVEFGFSLKTLGYDPNPTKLWLSRLNRAGFQDVRRAWMCLPMGAKRNYHKPPTPPLKDSPDGQDVRTCRLQAITMGSSDDIAGVCSIVGGWSWERWLLRCEMEKVSGELRLADTVTTGAAMEEAGKCLEGVPAVIEEGRNCKSGFRMLNGYARKPKAGTEVIKIVLGIDWQAEFDTPGGSPLFICTLSRQNM